MTHFLAIGVLMAAPNWSDLVQQFRDASPVQPMAAANVPQPLDQDPGFADVDLPLSELQNAAKKVAVSGYGILFLQYGSDPNVRLTLQMGSEIRNVKPGDIFFGRFESFTVSYPTDTSTPITYFRTTYNWAWTTVRLRILKRPDVRYFEPIDGPKIAPANLLGTPSVLVTVPEDTHPDSATAYFTLLGARKLQVLVDCGGGVNRVTQFTLVPWLAARDLSVSPVWAEYPQGAVTVTETGSAFAVSGPSGCKRIVTIDLGAPRFTLGYIEARALTPAGATGLDINVQSLE